MFDPSQRWISNCALLAGFRATFLHVQYHAVKMRSRALRIAIEYSALDRNNGARE